MANFVRYDARPALKSPILVEGLPGIGGVGKLAADFLAESLGAKRMARLYSDRLPPHASVDSECKASLACHELRYVEDVGGHDVVFLLGDYQGIGLDDQYVLSETVFRILLENDPHMVIALAGYGFGEGSRVLGAVSNPSLKQRLEGCGVSFVPGEPEGGIVGAAAALVGLGEIYGVDAVCLMGETVGTVADPAAAARVAESAAKILGVDLDVSPLAEGQAEDGDAEAHGSDRLSYYGRSGRRHQYYILNRYPSLCPHLAQTGQSG